MIEALACGTPVIARPRGSVPEVLVDGETGLLAEGFDDLVRAAAAVDRLDRRACRAAAERCFSVEAMADRYEALYRRLIAGRVGRAA
jgi:glycosyltransferase involved in cell wall biosynthesis